MDTKRGLKTAGVMVVFGVVLVCVFCSAAFGQYGGGSGTAEDPYLIYTAAQMNTIGANLWDWDKHFKLMANIDLGGFTGQSFNKIGIWGGLPFTGVFDGNGRTISNFTYNSSGRDYTGLFGGVDGASAEIKDLGLINPDVDGGNGEYVGALVGRIGEGSITDCYVEGGSVSGDVSVGGLVGSGGTITDCYSETVSVSGRSRVGGLVGGGGNISDCSSNASVSGTYSSVGGLVGSGGNISNCHSTGSVSGTAGSFGLTAVGGLVGSGGTIRDSYSAGSVSVSGNNIWGIGGLAGSGGNISNCYSTATVSASGSNVHGTGGLVGKSGDIANCYATGSVSGTSNVGGLMGENHTGTVVNCYSTGSVSGITGLGGLVGYNSGLVSACFWDKQSSGQTTSAGGTGKTTAEMQDINTFLSAGWDFVNQADGPSDDWAGPETQGYMILWWQLPEGQLPALPTFSGGTGEANDPYLISTASELNRIGHNPRLMAASPHFKLVNDIDLAGVDFSPIGSGWHSYRGVFDGNGHTISNLTYSWPPASYIGFFGGIAGKDTEVKDLGLIAPNIDAGAGHCVGSMVGLLTNGVVSGCYVDSGSVSGGGSVGGLVGKNSGAVVNCSWTGSVSGTDSFVGGLVGENGGTITNCHSNGTVSSVGVAVGGLVGQGGVITDCSSTCDVSGLNVVGGLVASAVTVTNCYALGDVSGELQVGGLIGFASTVMNCHSGGSVTGDRRVGGLAGETNGTVTNCYSTGDVSGNLRVGGLVGLIKGAELGADGNISNCYSTGNVTGTTEVGGLVGSGRSVCTSFWDTQTSGQSTNGSGTPKTTAEMQTASTFIGWNGCGSEGVWVLDEGNDYPRLWWENKPGEPLPTESLSDFVAGAGTEQDPYLIETGEQMNMVGVFWCEWNKHFKLMADIDLSGTAFNMIGIYGYGFGGTFDGNGHTISNFTYDSNNTDHIGLFGAGGGIRDLGLINPNVDGGTGNGVGSLIGSGSATGCYVEGGSVAGGNIVGGLVGGGSATNCTSSASVSGISDVGGLVGSGSASNCTSSASVSGTTGVGGLLGSSIGVWNGFKKTSSCYSDGIVSGVTEVGGLVGRNEAVANGMAEVTNCYSTASVTGYWYVGGLVGRNVEEEGFGGEAAVTNCYSAGGVSGISDVGGLVGYNERGVITDSFWDVNTSGQTNSDGGVGLTTELMQSALVFTLAGWDFTTPVWTIDEGVDYPRLGWESVLSVDIDMDEFWMYQSLPGQSNSDLTAGVSVTDDPMGNSSYSYGWEIVLAGDVSLAPVTAAGGGAGDAYWTFAARGCDEPAGLSDSGQTFTVRVTVTGDDYGNTGQAEAEFGIALLGDTNNDGVVNVADRSITNAFWRTGSAGPYTLRDCDVNCDGVANVADRSIANAIWRGILGQNSVSSPCPLR